MVTGEYLILVPTYIFLLYCNFSSKFMSYLGNSQLLTNMLSSNLSLVVNALAGTVLSMSNTTWKRNLFLGANLKLSSVYNRLACWKSFMPGRPLLNPDKKLLMLGILYIYSHKKSAVKGASFAINEMLNYIPPPVLNEPRVLVNAVPIPVPCGVCTALSYLIDKVIVTGSDVA